MRTAIITTSFTAIRNSSLPTPIRRGAWSEERHKQAEAEILSGVIASQKEAETHGTLHSGPHPSARDMFEGVFEEMPPHLRRQRQQGGI